LRSVKRRSQRARLRQPGFFLSCSCPAGGAQRPDPRADLRDLPTTRKEMLSPLHAPVPEEFFVKPHRID
jgi:hypothetical protein